MANVAFKSGVSSALFASGFSYTEGTFYLTTDTHKLYVYRNSELIDLNHFIKFVSTQSQLFALDAQVGDFAYVINDNILVYKKSDSDPETLSDWTQVNPDTQLSTSSNAVSLSTVTSGVAVATSVSDTAGNTASGSFSLVAGNNNVHLSQSGGVITITTDNDSSDHQYAVGTSASANSGLITLETTFNGTTSTATVVTIKGSNDGQASVSSDASGVITIDVPVQEVVNALSFNDSGVLTANSTLGAAGASSSVTPTVSYGHANVDGVPNSTGAATSTAVFASGVAVLDVYTAGQVDALIENYMQTADAMTYKGVVSASDVSSKITSSADVGDTYKVNGSFTATINGSPVELQNGDLLIAEGEDGNVTWSIVESGDSQAVQGAVTTSSFRVEDGNSNHNFIKVDLANSSGNDGRATINISGVVTTSDATGGEVTYTFSHGDAGSGTAVATAASATATTLAAAGTGAGNSTATTLSIPVVTGLSIDGAGHVTTASAATYVVTDTHANIDDVTFTTTATSTSAATMTVTVSDSDGEGDAESITLITSTGSCVQYSTATVSNKTALSIDFVWGTF